MKSLTAFFYWKCPQLNSWFWEKAQDRDGRDQVSGQAPVEGEEWRVTPRHPALASASSAVVFHSTQSWGHALPLCHVANCALYDWCQPSWNSHEAFLWELICTCLYHVLRIEMQWWGNAVGREQYNRKHLFPVVGTDHVVLTVFCTNTYRSDNVLSSACLGLSLNAPSVQ